MANKRKLSEKHDNIFKRGKKLIDDMVENGNIDKKAKNKINATRSEKQSLKRELVLTDRGMDIINKVNFTNFNLERTVPAKDEGPSNLSWLVNLSAASLFTDAQPKQTESVHCISVTQTSVTGEQPTSYETNLKPGLTYTELIEKALKEHGELTVSEIYKWIYSHYPYYKKNDGRWKNSIRHNLSINPQFRKGMKCNNGGHFWTLNKEYDEQFKKWQENKKTIRGDRRKKLMYKAEEEEIEIATRSIMLQEDNSNDSDCFRLDSDPSLVRVATDILSGVDKQVEVEYMNRVDGLSAPLVIEEDIMECSDPMLADPLLFSDCLELGFQPYELIDSRL